MTSPGQTVRPDLSQEQLIRLIILTYQLRPRNWRWLTDWVKNTNGWYSAGNVTFHPSGSTHVIPMADAESVIRYYEDQANWADFTEEDMAAS